MRKFVLLLLLVGMTYAGWRHRDVLADWAGRSVAWASGWRDGHSTPPAKPVPDLAMYEVLRGDLDAWRKKLRDRHRAARTAAAKEAAERDARVLLETALPEMMRCWLGTPWDFNGTAAGPGNDPIACGYFVSTVLKDAGFQVDRYRLAQQPSSRILTSMVPKDTCRLMVDLPYERFAGEVQSMERGVYLVGLDTHVAFLVVSDDGFRFIHSSGADPWCVVDEGRDEAEVLRKSRWRMMANLTADSGLLRKWLASETFAVRGL